MSNLSLREGSLSRLTAQSDAIGRFAEDDGALATVVAAFESKDPIAFRWVLDRLGMQNHCALICEWVQIKLCVLRCQLVCGPVQVNEDLFTLAGFVRAVVRLAADEKLLTRVVDAVICGNPRQYRAAIAEAKLEAFCHPICRWVCSVVYRRICEILCTTVFVPQPDPVREIRAAAVVMAKLIENEKALTAISKAAETLDSEATKAALRAAGLHDACEIVCRVIWMSSDPHPARRFARVQSRAEPGLCRPPACRGSPRVCARGTRPVHRTARARRAYHRRPSCGPISSKLGVWETASWQPDGLLQLPEFPSRPMTPKPAVVQRSRFSIEGDNHVVR
jgi:hypothetical protein